MDKSLQVTRAEEFLRKSFDNSAWMREHEADKNYRLEHSFRVANIARQIAEAEGMDGDALYIGGLLHDISYCESWENEENGWINHGRRAAEMARPFLKELGMNEEVIQEICYGIAIHVDDKSDFPGERTGFALSIGTADNIDRMDVYRIYENLQYVKFSEKSLTEKLKWLDEKIDNLTGWEGYIQKNPSSATADRMLLEKIAYQKEFYNKLREQLKLSW